LVGDIDPDWLRHRFRGRLLYSLRSHRAGGRFLGSWQERREFLRRAGERYDLVELEGTHDLRGELLQHIPPSRRLISIYRQSAGWRELLADFRQLAGAEARFYKVVIEAAHEGDELASLVFLKALARADTVAFATGPTGSWSRLLAPHLGAPVVFGLVGDSATLPGEFTITQLVKDYGLPELAPVEELFGIVGGSARYSLSPRLHNNGYRALGRPALYVPFPTTSFQDFWREVVLGDPLEDLGMPLRGLTVGAPHKEAVLGFSTPGSRLAQRSRAANVSFRTARGWRAETTDPEGVLAPLRRRRIALTARPVAVIGCGGAGRAVAVALAGTGARVTLVNRGLARGRWASRRFDMPFIPLSEFDPAGFAAVVNATPLGRERGEVPFAPERLAPGAVVIDLVYGPHPTELVSRVRQSGGTVIDGHEVLLVQARRQFHLMTGQRLSVGSARAALGWPAGGVDGTADGAWSSQQDGGTPYERL
jgi:3-dehydroquinate dehydratase/shikimate dehydrogenase